MLSHELKTEWPVIVVGAGPTGLVAAISLARSGNAVLVLNKRVGVWEVPRATVVSLRSMELFRSWGLEEEIRTTGEDVEWLMRSSRTLAQVAEGHSIEVGFPTKAESALLSPTRPATIPQDQLESVLTRELRRLPNARLMEGTEAMDVRFEGGGVRVSVRDVGSGIRGEFSARYVVAADGAHSRLRQAAGIGTREWPTPVHASSVLFHAPLWEVVGPHRHGIYVVESPRPATLLPAGHGDRWVHSVAWTDPEPEPPSDDTTSIARIRASVGIDDLPVRLVRTDTFSFSAALADSFRAGNLFLAGDAAHRVTPRGGTGMNTAIADGRDLGWKLSWVLRGWAPEALLSSYEAERRPVAEHNVARSLDPLGSRRPSAAEVQVDLGGRIPHRWVPGPNGPVSTLDLLGPSLTPLADGTLVRPDGIVWNEETVLGLLSLAS